MSWIDFLQWIILTIIISLALIVVATLIGVIIDRKNEGKHDEKTMAKVYQALGESGLDINQTLDAVSNLQNHGILFRERS
jgi:hypothetical protein